MTVSGTLHAWENVQHEEPHVPTRWPIPRPSVASCHLPRRRRDRARSHVVPGARDHLALAARDGDRSLLARRQHRHDGSPGLPVPRGRARSAIHDREPRRRRRSGRRHRRRACAAGWIHAVVRRLDADHQHPDAAEGRLRSAEGFRADQHLRCRALSAGCQGGGAGETRCNSSSPT